MGLKGTKIYSIAKMKCPRCHEGDLYPEPNPYKLGKLFEMYDRCPVCGQNYQPEPSFYYGSMYVSYGYTVALFVAVFLIGKFLLGWEVWGIIALLTGVLLVLAPVLFRISRATWINIFVKYRPDWRKEN